MKPLQPRAQHRAIDLIKQALGDVDNPIRRDPEQVAIVGQVVDRAQRDPVDNGRRAQRIAIVDDVRRLQQRCLSQPAEAPGGRPWALRSPGTARRGQRTPWV